MAHILCPACRTNTVTAVSWKFSQTSVEVPACSDCQLAGVRSLNIKVSGIADLDISLSNIRHRDGLAEFG